VREQREAAGHSVRAMYLYTGMTDVAARADVPGYAEALDAARGRPFQPGRPQRRPLVAEGLTPY
jgi:hypothetical protein